MIEKKLEEVQKTIEALKKGDLSFDEIRKMIENSMKLIESIEVDLEKEEKKMEIFSKTKKNH